MPLAGRGESRGSDRLIGGRLLVSTIAAESTKKGSPGPTTAGLPRRRGVFLSDKPDKEFASRSANAEHQLPIALSVDRLEELFERSHLSVVSPADHVAGSNTRLRRVTHRLNSSDYQCARLVAKPKAVTNVIVKRHDHHAGPRRS